jgi:N-acetylmuramoyl-L-alanine amidase
MKSLCLLALLLLPLAVMAEGRLAGRKICIDPGHPSEVGVGTTGQKISELKACWLVALAVKEYLRREGAEVRLTKTAESQKVLNKDRAAVANGFKADLMLRLHCDAEGGSGFGTYYPDRAATVSGHHGPSDAVLKASKQYAPIFHKAVMQSLGGALRDRGVMTERQTAVGARQGALTGSVFSEVPVLLVEMAVLSNRHDDEYMASRDGQLAVAKALVEGVCALFPPAN